MEYIDKNNERRLSIVSRSYNERRSPYECLKFPLYEEFDLTRQDSIFDSCTGVSNICEFLACSKICDDQEKLLIADIDIWCF